MARRNIEGDEESFAISEAYQVPCLIFQGEKDEITDLEASKQFFADLSGQRKNFYIINDAFHEVFNENGREELTAKLIEWLARAKTRDKS